MYKILQLISIVPLTPTLWKCFHIVPSRFFLKDFAFEKEPARFET